MKFALINFLFFTIILSAVKAQDQKMLDSLENAYNSSKDLKLKLKIAGDLAWSYGNLNFNKSLFYGKEELKLAQASKDSASIALAYSDLGNTYTRVNKFNEALSNHLKALDIRNKLGLKEKAAGSISNISIIYKQLGNFKEAIVYMHKSLKIYENTGDEAKQSLVLGNMGNVYINFNKFEAAKESYDKAIYLGKKVNATSLVAAGYSGLMKYYYNLKNYPQALKNGLFAANYLKDLNQKNDLAAIYNTIGQVYYGMGNYTEAMNYYNKALIFRESMNDELGIASCYKNLGETYSALKDFTKAEDYLNKSIKIFNRLKSQDYLREAYKTLGVIFEANQDYVNSLKFYKESVAIKDSIYNKQSTDKINELQIAYQTERKIQQISLLNKENKIQKLTLQKHNVLMGIALGIFVITILFGVLFYKSIRLKQKARLQEEVILQQDLATKAVLGAEENERKRISGELHDGLGQMFSAVKMNLSALTEDINFKNPESKNVFTKTLDLVDESCKEVRAISHQMAPNVLLKSGLATAIRDFINKIDARKLKINLETFGLQHRLDPSIETVLYRVIQETVNNVIKHSGANSLDIQLSKDEEGINAMIEDNGKGFDSSSLEKFEGIGLKNIRSRVEYLKGTVDFSSTPGSGTLVAIHIPL